VAQLAKEPSSSLLVSALRRGDPEEDELLAEPIQVSQCEARGSPNEGRVMNTMPFRKRSGVSNSGQSGSKPDRDANGLNSRSRGDSKVLGAAGSGAALPGSGAAQRVAGKSTKAAAPRKKPAEQSPQAERFSGKLRRRACVLCGRLFKPSPQSPSTRKYCSQCRQAHPEWGKATPSAKRQVAANAERVMSRKKKKKSAPLTGVCAVCSIRVRVRKDGMIWSHRSPEKAANCQGTGMGPKPGTVSQKPPIRKATPPRFLSMSVHATPSGLPSLGRRR
jgi:hypothetical protein